MSKKAIFLRFTNGTILTVIIALTFTGLYGLMWPMPGWMYDIHRITAWGLVGLIPAKVLIVSGSLKRGFDRRFKRSVVPTISLLTAGWTLLVLGLALVWAWNLNSEWRFLYQSALAWHCYLALALLVPFIFHIIQKWPRPRKTDFTERRSALKLLGLGALSIGAWGLSEAVSDRRDDVNSPRAQTGSREENSFSGLDYPVSMMVGEGKIRIDINTWTFSIKGAVDTPLSMNYGEIISLPPTEVTATLDCTDGWYTTQVWRGVPLKEILQRANADPDYSGVILKAASGYPAFLFPHEAEETLLATHVSGVVPDHWHGFPLRAVVPSRRGWQWVKWLIEIEVV